MMRRMIKSIWRCSASLNLSAAIFKLRKMLTKFPSIYDGCGACFTLKLIAVSICAAWLSTASATDHQTDIINPRAVVTDYSEVKIYELGVKHSENQGAVLYGNPKSKRYPSWYKYVQGYDSGYAVVNELQRILHKTEVIDDVVTIFREYAYICADVSKCEAFIDKALDLLMTKLVLAKVYFQQGPKPLTYFIRGSIYIYGIDEPAAREKLRTYWKIHEIRKLGDEFKATVAFTDITQVIK